MLGRTLTGFFSLQPRSGLQSSYLAQASRTFQSITQSMFVSGRPKWLVSSSFRSLLEPACRRWARGKDGVWNKGCFKWSFLIDYRFFYMNISRIWSTYGLACRLLCTEIIQKNINPVSSPPIQHSENARLLRNDDQSTLIFSLGFFLSVSLWSYFQDEEVSFRLTWKLHFHKFGFHSHPSF